MDIKDIGAELCISAAQAHGEDSEPDFEPGDLQVYLRSMWKLLTPFQQLQFMQTPEVLETLEGALVEEDQAATAYQHLATALQVPPATAFVIKLITAFPGFYEGFEELLVIDEDADTDVNGGDLVDWLTEEMPALQAMAPDLYAQVAARFPGLVDGEQDVNGADLVDFLNEVVSKQ